MIGNFGNHRHFRPGARDDRGVDPFHVRGNEIDQGIDRWLARAFEWYDDSHFGHFSDRTGQAEKPMVASKWVGSTRVYIWTSAHEPAPAAALGKGSTDVARSCMFQGGPGCVQAAKRLTMRELVRTTDAVLISAIEALLNGARIKHLVVDQNMSVLEGSIGIFPRRILV